jgi:hypothetical protein
MTWLTRHPFTASAIAAISGPPNATKGMQRTAPNTGSRGRLQPVLRWAGAEMPRSDPFDFSEFGAGRAARTPPVQPHTADESRGPTPNRVFDTGFDPFADRRSGGSDTRHEDVFAPRTAGALGAEALTVARPPMALFALAFALAALGVAIGLLWGPRLAAAFAGWLLAGPVAIGVLAEFTRVDTRRRTHAVYSAPRWVPNVYWAILGVCLLGIAVGAWHIALWAGTL